MTSLTGRLTGRPAGGPHSTVLSVLITASPHGHGPATSLFGLSLLVEDIHFGLTHGQDINEEPQSLSLPSSLRNAIIIEGTA